MTNPTFRPISDEAFDTGVALSAEHGRRIVRDTLAGLNQRPMQIGSPFRRYSGGGVELQTLWRWSVQWGYIGPWRVYSPRNGTVRVLLGLRTNGGAGAVRLYMVPDRDRPRESDMTADTNGATSGEQAYYRMTTSSADVALVLRVDRGWNAFWLAIRCEEDTGRARETFSGANLAASTGIGLARNAPALTPETVDDDPVGMFAECAQSSTEHGNGLFDTFTVAAIDGGEERVLYEPASLEWRLEVVDTAAVGYVEIGWLTALYIDSLSIDGTGALTLEDRGFGAAFRYRQTLSAAFAGQAIGEAQVAHTARMPMVALGTDLDTPAAASSTTQFANLRRYALMTGSAVTVATVGLGVAAATPDIDWQGLFPGRSYQFQVQFSALMVAAGPVAVAPDSVEFVARIVDASGAAIDTGETVPATLRVLTQRNTAVATQALGSAGSITSANEYGLEGMTLRDDLDAWQTITLTVTATGNLDTAPVQRLQIQATGTSLNVLCITPPCVRMVEA